MKRKILIAIICILIILILVVSILFMFKNNNFNNKPTNENIIVNENNDSNKLENENFNNEAEDESLNIEETKTKVIKTTTASISLSYESSDSIEHKEVFAEVSIENGNLSVTTRRYIIGKEDRMIDNSYTPINKIFSIDGEKIKVLHHNYYQPSNTNVIYYLTENGNIYVNKFSVCEDKIDIINNFEKMNYSNVSEIVMQVNDNYGQKLDPVIGIIDSRKHFIYAKVDEKLLYLEYQYMG